MLRFPASALWTAGLLGAASACQVPDVSDSQARLQKLWDSVHPAPADPTAPTGHSVPDRAPPPISTQAGATRLPRHPVDPHLVACARAAGGLSVIEPGGVTLRTTIIGQDKVVAVLDDADDTPWVVHKGDFIGRHCWRVDDIDEGVVTVRMHASPDGGPVSETRHIIMGASPAALSLR